MITLEHKIIFVLSLIVAFSLGCAVQSRIDCAAVNSYLKTDHDQTTVTLFPDSLSVVKDWKRKDVVVSNIKYESADVICIHYPNDEQSQDCFALDDISSR